ncbi:MAG: hypothetical protein ACTHLX_06150 [Candidatus Binatia bacterium]
MFIQDFKKFRLSAVAIGIVVLLYTGINAVLLTFSQWVESHTEVYPYRGEDWLRYLLADLFTDRGKNRIMLVGESAVRENLLYEEFNRAFPTMDTFQGGLSLGTMSDVMISLQYIKEVYGRGALPEVLVVGISPRFVANLPEERPLMPSIDLYSPYFAVEESAIGPHLKPKTSWEQWTSSLRFLMFKQQRRYLAAAAALARDYVSVNQEAHNRAGRVRSLIQAPLLLVDRLTHKALGNYLRRAAAPYKYHHLQPMRVEGLRRWLRDPNSWWHRVHSWDPDANERIIADQFRRLREFAENEQIALYVINLPENIESRELYRGQNYQCYLDLIQRNLGSTPFLDLHAMLGPGEFYDVVHATLPGAKRVTQAVIEFIKGHTDTAPELAAARQTIP